MPVSRWCACCPRSTSAFRKSAGRAPCGHGAHHLEPAVTASFGRADSLSSCGDAPIRPVLERLHAELFRLVDEAIATAAARSKLTMISQSTPRRWDDGDGCAGHRGRPRRRAGISACRAGPATTPNAGAQDAGAMMFVPSIGGISHHWSEIPPMRLGSWCPGVYQRHREGLKS